ncbi:sugar kinase [Gordonia sp. NB41Y]|uniref:sugar kinase n=1 Tax=Gordonia sp. NB41Y TaxID=875808 RepID=UPI00273A9C84|nr:sugar kinase [Gordonia sp. NB41Y]WLP92860.1 sugar kinase [Gordonia sp. NB41Y]
MRVLTFGETMALTRSRDVGPISHSADLRLGIGGSESNVAIALRRLGVPVTWVGRVGADGFGELVRRELRAEGIDARVICDETAPTGLMVKERRTPDAGRVWYYRSGSAGSRLHPADITDGDIADASLVHLTGITPALSESARDTTFDVVARARAAGVTVSFDLNYRRALWSPDEAGAVYRELIPLADIVFGGDEELAMAVGAGSPEQLAERVLDAGAGEAVVKLGADGALDAGTGTLLRVPAVKVTVVDSVGAGDGFVAGYLAEYLAGADLTTRLSTATAVGAFACTGEGDWESLPRRDELGLLGADEPVIR